MEEKFALRKLDFPLCAQECFKHLERALLPSSKFASASSTAARQMREIQNSLDEFVFCIADRRGASRRLNAMQELQLAHLFCEYFASAALMDSKERYHIFEVLFLGRESEPAIHEGRIAFLAKCASLAITMKCQPLLADIAQWVYKLGTSHRNTKLVLTQLLQDHCSPGAVTYEQLLDLAGEGSEKEPSVASPSRDPIWRPSFVSCIFIVALTPLELFDVPNKELLVVLVEWFSTNPKFLVRALRSSSTGGKGGVSIAKNAASCLTKVLITSVVGPVDGKVSNDLSLLEWNKLHVGLLQLLLHLSREKLTVECLNAKVVSEIFQRLKALKKSDEGEGRAEGISGALDRLAQIVQLTLAGGCFMGSKKELERAYKESGFEHPLLDFLSVAV